MCAAVTRDGRGVVIVIVIVVVVVVVVVIVDGDGDGDVVDHNHLQRRVSIATILCSNSIPRR